MTPWLTTTRLVLQHTLARTRTTMIFWAIGVGLYTVVILLAYPTFKNNMLPIVERIPDNFQTAFGLQHLDEVGSFLFARVYQMLPLVLAFLPISISAAALAGAEERGALDTILTQPMNRRTLVVSTWLATLIDLGIVLAVTGMATWITTQLINEPLSLGEAVQAVWNVLPVTLVLGSIGLLLSAMMRTRGAVLGASIGIVFLLYLIEVIGKIMPDLDALRWITPFRYFGDVAVFHVPWWHYALMVGASLLLLLGSILIFDRKDIYT